ncbi:MULTISPECIES: formimidoylglutamase [Flavobacterium]|uniref:Formimidoylglutamase n=1 Tax=Flavobacterium covae TaxID=2906076 RepID=A0ABW8PFD4_9FLAO|nr:MULTISPECIES: formimidoylglutamase [Flavobacterium]OXA83600.1 arginase [Flavobacterium columnare] [Flavobacterium columnare NBRC 100251 = ATCC 23463]AMA50009.1 arginase [Flavobacterium covae]AND64461.1 arginase [Flavobacterium covae]MCJ1807464.1 formimidoylglutamase [Flavobacterium covae]MCJ1808679.1 formimidoylglutamase [Flavobacterium covae]
MVFDFLKPLDVDFLIDVYNFPEASLGRKIQFNTHEEFPDLRNVSIAIVGVLEERGGGKNNTNLDLSLIRKSLYSLYPGNWNVNIVDLGDIIGGAELEDTYFVLKGIVEQLVKNNIIPIVIGGSQDLTYAIYRGYDRLEQMVNVVTIDSQFDFARDNGLLADSYLTKMIVDEPNNLFNYSNIGYQTYFNSQEEIDLIEKLYFDSYRLGEVAHDPTITEPVLRDADLVSIDMKSVMSSNSGNFVDFMPNGFSGKEICAFSRYAGLSDKVTTFGIFNHKYTASESVLIAQVIWYFIEGYHYRSNEYPFGTKSNFIKYIVPLEEELIFYKSDKTGRWWIEIPFLSNSYNKLKKNTLLPCTYDDYLDACEGIVPERWWKAQRKNLL